MERSDRPFRQVPGGTGRGSQATGAPGGRFVEWGPPCNESGVSHVMEGVVAVVWPPLRRRALRWRNP